jgi:hypothetical protein
MLFFRLHRNKLASLYTPVIGLIKKHGLCFVRQKGFIRTRQLGVITGDTHLLLRTHHQVSTSVSCISLSREPQLYKSVDTPIPHTCFISRGAIRSTSFLLQVCNGILRLYESQEESQQRQWSLTFRGVGNQAPGNNDILFKLTLLC